MTKYVLGFYFSFDRSKVALIFKKRPKWQAGFLNGIGGHIDEGETAYDAMCREFKEETGVEVHQWRYFGDMTFPEAVVRLYETAGAFDKLFSATDEQITIVHVRDLSHVKTVPNLQWLIPLACDKTVIFSYLRGQ